MNYEERVINDLASLPNLNEEIILNHLKARYKHNLIYVNYLIKVDYLNKNNKYLC